MNLQSQQFNALEELTRESFTKPKKIDSIKKPWQHDKNECDNCAYHGTDGSLTEPKQ